jgi:hypothetical protein
MSLDEWELRADWALRGRCERGIDRLLDRAELACEDHDGAVWVVWTRALIVRNARVITVLVSSTSRGFGERFHRSSAPVSRTRGMK